MPEGHTARDAALEALGWSRGALEIGSVPATELVERFGSPLYVYDAGVLRTRIAAFHATFGPRVELLFALKANPSAALAAVARDAGCGAEIASAGEVLVAAAAGFAGEVMQFTGPGKSAADLRTALEHEVGCLNVESEREYERIAALSATLDRRQGIAIRVNPGTQQSGARLRMATESSRFGIDRARVVPLAQRIVADGACALRGLHVYAGSQSFDADAWVAGARALLELATEVETATGHPLASLNLGGGFGWPVYDGDPTFDLDLAAHGVRALIDADARDDRRWFVELGRWLAAPCGVYLTRVVDIKDSGGARHAILDGGMHHCGAAAGLGAVMRRAYGIVAADQPVTDATHAVTLGGPLCTPADRLGVDLALPGLAEGSTLAVLNAGAYGLTFSPTGFLGHPAPAEVLVDAARATEIRERGSPADALRGQRLP